MMAFPNNFDQPSFIQVHNRFGLLFLALLFKTVLFAQAVKPKNLRPLSPDRPHQTGPPVFSSLLKHCYYYRARKKLYLTRDKNVLSLLRVDARLL